MLPITHSSSTSSFCFPSMCSVVPAITLPTNTFTGLANLPVQMGGTLLPSLPPSSSSSPDEQKQLFNTSSDAQQMASILASPRQRAETFIVEEVKLMMQEIELRKHVLLSLSPSTHRLKRRAWEEVAAVIAARWPHSPRRTADQVKKKWENLVSKTKRKIRSGHMTSDLDWSETNSVVFEFLVQHSPLARMRYSSALNNSLPSGCDTRTTFATPSAPVVAPASTTSLFPNSSALLNGGLHQSVESHAPNLINSLASVYTSLREESPSSFVSSTAASIGAPTSQHFAGGRLKPLDRLAASFHDQEDLKVNVTLSAGGISLSNKPGTSGAPESMPATLQTLGLSGEQERSAALVSNEQSIVSDALLNLPNQPIFPMEISNSLADLSQSCGSSLRPNVTSSEVQQTMLKQYEKEHHLRMEILSLQKQAWALQVQLLQSKLVSR